MRGVSGMTNQACKGWSGSLVARLPAISWRLGSSFKAMVPHSSTLAWKIPWMEDPGGPQSMRLLRVGHDWATSLSLFTFMHWRRKWQPTSVFLPGESQGWGSLVGCRLWGRRVRHDWSHLATAQAAVLANEHRQLPARLWGLNPAFTNVGVTCIACYLLPSLSLSAVIPISITCI